MGVPTIALIYTMVTRFRDESKQRKKALVYNVFEGKQGLDLEQILRRLRAAPSLQDYGDINLLGKQSPWARLRNRIKKKQNRIVAFFTTRIYSVRSAA